MLMIKNFNNTIRILNNKIKDINTQKIILQFNPKYKLKINQKYLIDNINDNINVINNIKNYKSLKNEINWKYISDYKKLSKSLTGNNIEEYKKLSNNLDTLKKKFQ
jgi:hypothetical protein